MKFKDSFHPYAMVTILFWSLAYPLTKIALQDFSPYTLGFLRYLTASIALAAVVFLMKLHPPKKKDWTLFLFSGFVGFFIYMIAFNTGQGMVTASTASVVVATVPVITALMARFAYKEKLKVFQWIAIAIEFIGVAVLTLMDGMLSVNVGLIWLLLAVLALSTYNLIQRKMTSSYTALQASTYSIFCGTVMLAVFAPKAVSHAAAAPGIQFVIIGILGVCSGAIAYVTWAKAFAKAEKTSHVSNYMFVTPFLASLLGFVMINEVPDLPTVLGGSIIILGMIMFNFGNIIFSGCKEKKLDT